MRCRARAMRRTSCSRRATFPCKTNPLGVKGAGEAGAIGSCPAVMNAIVDALWRAHRIRHIDMPATPQRIWQAIRSARVTPPDAVHDFVIADPSLKGPE